VLPRALARLQPSERANGRRELTRPDDAAVVAMPTDKGMVPTGDCFRALVDDLYGCGKMASQPSLGASFARDADAPSARAIASVQPQTHPREPMTIVGR
jgi:selenide,water dikinase